MVYYIIPQWFIRLTQTKGTLSPRPWEPTIYMTVFVHQLLTISEISPRLWLILIFFNDFFTICFIICRFLRIYLCSARTHCAVSEFFSKPEYSLCYRSKSLKECLPVFIDPTYFYVRKLAAAIRNIFNWNSLMCKINELNGDNFETVLTWCLMFIDVYL